MKKTQKIKNFTIEFIEQFMLSWYNLYHILFIGHENFEFQPIYKTWMILFKEFNFLGKVTIWFIIWLIITIIAGFLFIIGFLFSCFFIIIIYIIVLIIKVLFLK